jgi:hypothetical protein
MGGTTNRQSGKARVLWRLAITLAAVMPLAACQSASEMASRTATTTFENPSLFPEPERLPPFVAPDRSQGVIVSFLPFSGVPTNTADTIYKAIRSHASDEGVKLALRLDEPATYRVKTYINAVGNSSSATYVFIVEIYDAGGARVHRFVGQEYGPAPSGDPWNGIDTDTMHHLGDRILQGVKAWLTRSGA